MDTGIERNSFVTKASFSKSVGKSDLAMLISHVVDIRYDEFSRHLGYEDKRP